MVVGTLTWGINYFYFPVLVTTQAWRCLLLHNKSFLLSCAVNGQRNVATLLFYVGYSVNNNNFTKIKSTKCDIKILPRKWHTIFKARI